MRSRTLIGALMTSVFTVCCAGRDEPARAPPSQPDADLRVAGLADAGCVTDATSSVVEVSVEFGRDGAPDTVQIVGADHPRDEELRCIASFVKDHAFPHSPQEPKTGR